MFHAICEFMQFQDCDAQIRNCKPILKRESDFKITLRSFEVSV